MRHKLPFFALLFATFLTFGSSTWTGTDYKCLNDGTPFDDNTCKCKSDPYYSGKTCDSLDCLNGGKKMDGGFCSCAPGFLGRHCEPVKCVEQDVGSFKVDKTRRDLILLMTYNQNFKKQMADKNGGKQVKETICSAIASLTDLNADQIVVIDVLTTSFEVTKNKADCLVKLGPDFLEDQCQEDFCDEPLLTQDILEKVNKLREDGRLIIISNYGIDDTTGTASERNIALIKKRSISMRLQIHSIVLSPPESAANTIYDEPQYQLLREISEATLGFFISPFYAGGGGSFGKDDVLSTVTALFPQFFDYSVIDRLRTTEDNCGSGSTFFTLQPREETDYHITVRSSSSSDVFNFEIEWIGFTPALRVDTGLFFEFNITIPAGQNTVFSVATFKTLGDKRACIATTIMVLEKTAELARLSVANDNSVDVSIPYAASGPGVKNILVGHFTSHHTDHLKNLDVKLDGGNFTYAPDKTATPRPCQYNVRFGYIQCEKNAETFIRVRDFARLGKAVSVQPFFCAEVLDDMDTTSIMFQDARMLDMDSSNCESDPSAPFIERSGKQRTLALAIHNSDNIREIVLEPPSLITQLKDLFAAGSSYYKELVSSVFINGTEGRVFVSDDFPGFRTTVLNGLNGRKDTQCFTFTGLLMIHDIIAEMQPNSDILIIADHRMNKDQNGFVQGANYENVLNLLYQKRCRLVVLLVACTDGSDSLNVDDFEDWHRLAFQSGGYALHFDDKNALLNFFGRDQYLSLFNKDVIASRDRIGKSMPIFFGDFTNSTKFSVKAGKPYTVAVVSNPPVDTITISGVPHTTTTTNKWLSLYEITPTVDASDVVVSVQPNPSAGYIYFLSIRVYQDPEDQFATVAFTSGDDVDYDSSFPETAKSNQWVVANAPSDAVDISVDFYNEKGVFYTTGSSDISMTKFPCSMNYKTGYNWQCTDSDTLFYLSTSFSVNETKYSRVAPFRCFHGANPNDPSCPNGGTREADKNCTCTIHWEGALCTEPICLNGGTRTLGNTCDCPDSYSGSFCEKFNDANSNCTMSEGLNFRSVHSTIIFVVEKSANVANAVKTWAGAANVADWKAAQFIIVSYSNSSDVNVVSSTNDPKRALTGLQSIDAINPGETLDYNPIPALKEAINTQLTESAILFWFAEGVVLNETFYTSLAQDVAVNRVSIRALFHMADATSSTETIRTLTALGGMAHYSHNTAAGAANGGFNINDFFNNYVSAIITNERKRVYYERRLNVAGVYPECSNSTSVFVSTSNNGDAVLYLALSGPGFTLSLADVPVTNFTTIATTQGFELISATLTTTGNYTVVRTAQNGDCLHFAEILNFNQVAFGFTYNEGDSEVNSAAVTGTNYLVTRWTAEWLETDSNKVPEASVVTLLSNGSFLPAVRRSTTIRSDCSFTVSLELNCTDDVQGYGVTMQRVLYDIGGSSTTPSQKYFPVMCLHDVNCGEPTHGRIENGRCNCFTGWKGVACEIPICQNGGTADLGACNCPLGFDGQFCDGIEPDATRIHAHLFIQDTCGTDSTLKALTTKVLRDYIKLFDVKNVTLAYIGTNAGVQNLTKIDATTTNVDDVLAQNDKDGCPKSADLAPVIVQFADALAAVKEDQSIRITKAKAMHVTQIAVPSTTPGQLEDLKEDYEFEQLSVGMTAKNVYFADSTGLKNYGTFAETYDYFTALTDFTDFEMPDRKPTPPPREPSCVHQVQSAFQIITDLSNIGEPAQSDYRQKIQKVVEKLTEDFNYVPKVNSKDDFSCTMDESEVANKTVMSTDIMHDGQISRPTFCKSNVTEYIGKIGKDNTWGAELNLKKVLAMIYKTYKSNFNMQCVCLQPNETSTSKIVLWISVSPTSADTDPVQLTEGFPTDQEAVFEHIILPFGYDKSGSPLWSGLIPNADSWVVQGDTHSVDEIVQDIWTKICRLAHIIDSPATAEPPRKGEADIPPFEQEPPSYKYLKEMQALEEERAKSVDSSIVETAEKQSQSFFQWMRSYVPI